MPLTVKNQNSINDNTTNATNTTSSNNNNNNNNNSVLGVRSSAFADDNSEEEEENRNQSLKKHKLNWMLSSSFQWFVASIAVCLPTNEPFWNPHVEQRQAESQRSTKVDFNGGCHCYRIVQNQFVRRWPKYVFNLFASLCASLKSFRISSIVGSASVRMRKAESREKISTRCDQFSTLSMFEHGRKSLHSNAYRCSSSILKTRSRCSRLNDASSFSPPLIIQRFARYCAAARTRRSSVPVDRRNELYCCYSFLMKS